MDEKTNTLASNFVNFMAQALRENKQYKAFKEAEIVNWSLKENRLTLDIFHHGLRLKIFADIRELKDTHTHFDHLLGNLHDQLQAASEQAQQQTE